MQNPTFVPPVTRVQKMAYLLALGNPPVYAARLAGYAGSSIGTAAARLARGKSVQRWQQRYSHALALLDHKTITQGLDALRRQLHAPNARTSLAAANALIRLSLEQTAHPHKDHSL